MSKAPPGVSVCGEDGRWPHAPTPGIDVARRRCATLVPDTPWGYIEERKERDVSRSARPPRPRRSS
jgi:hypothetical protein